MSGVRAVYEQGGVWFVRAADGRELEWRGMNTGPLALSDAEIEALGRAVGVAPETVEARAAEELRPATEGTALILHSTSPEKRTLEGELAALVAGESPYDSTTYAEARATLFARRGDLLVGRTEPWRAAVASDGLAGESLPDARYYYLSHALLELAARAPAALSRIVGFVRARSPVVRVYALDPAMLRFLLWLRRAAEVPVLRVEANLSLISRVWNRKSALYPTVEEAAALREVGGARRMLAAESAASPLARELGVALPILPGYTVSRAGGEARFVGRLLRAAELLRGRHGLRRGCLKAAVGGGGVGITPDVDLTDFVGLARLARAAYEGGDEQVLEAQVTYGATEVDGRRISLAPSAHIRRGRVAPGVTLQWTRGTTWIGNIYLDEATAPEFGVPAAMCRRIDAAMHDLRRGFERVGGLTIAGVDFSIGTIGGAYGDEVLLAAQDPNLSFNGAECLRGFLEREEGAPYGATLVVRPAAEVGLAELRAACRRLAPGADAIAAVPGRSGMLAIRGERPREAAGRLLALVSALQAAGLLLE